MKTKDKKKNTKKSKPSDNSNTSINNSTKIIAEKHSDPTPATESDDDIFADVGQYEGISSNTFTEHKQVSKSEKKILVFDGLRMKDNIKEANIQHYIQSRTIEAVPSKFIDYDVQGSRKSKKQNERVSVSQYRGGYGEEMDIDFDGSLATNSEDKHIKKKYLHSTEASKEYGNRRKRYKTDTSSFD